MLLIYREEKRNNKHEIKKLIKNNIVDFINKIKI